VAKREVGSPNRNRRHDGIGRLQEFYKSLKKKNNVDELLEVEEEMQLKESGASSSNLDEYVFDSLICHMCVVQCLFRSYSSFSYIT